MFVVHIIQDGKPTRTRDFGHVNQFFKMYPIFRQTKEEEIFKECINQGFMYMHFVLMPERGKDYYTYHKRLDLLLGELAYNRTKYSY